MVNNTYDINRAMMAIENEIMASMMRNMKRHRVEEVKENKQWSMWQAEQLKELERWKAEAAKKYNKRFLDINSAIDTLIMEARSQGNMDQEASILRAIKKGYKPPKVPKGKLTTTGEFFKLNDRKINALIKATKNDVKKAQHATLRMADDQYRKAIFNAQMYAASGAGTYEKAVDMAVKDYLARGITCVEYKNGARHTASDYIDMAIKTASKRAYFTGEGEKRKEWGITTVRVSQRQGACPKCAGFVGKVLIDDVWSGGKKTDGNYPLMSTAIARGLYHPRCLDGHSTYFPDVSTPPKPYTEEEKQDLLEAYRTEQKRQYAERQAVKYGRMAELMLDEGDRKEYKIKKEQWVEQTQAFRNGIEPISEETKVKASVENVANIKNADIIEMKRKLSDAREEYRYISDKTFDKLTIEAKKNGATIIRGTAEVEAHLDKMEAAASNIGDILMFRKNVCISEVIEETYHFKQNKILMNNDKEEKLRSILNEIDAKQYILDNASKYKIPRKEIELTERQLKSYQKELEKHLKGDG